MSWLRDRLERNSLHLFNRLSGLEKYVEKNILPFVHLPDYTKHGIDHSKEIEKNLSKLIPINTVDPLTEFEIFVLLTASLLHDVGMIAKENPDEENEEIRKDHHNRARKFVIDNKGELGLSKHEAVIIGEICRSHGMPNLSYLKGFEFEITSLQDFGEIRVSSLCALIRLADILDISSGRAPEVILKNRQLNSVSKRHWELHSCISSVDIYNEPSWDIVITGMPSIPEHLLHLRELTCVINDEINTMSLELRSIGLYYKNAYLKSTDINFKQKKTELKNNPFLQLAAFGREDANLFRGRDMEIEQLIERVLSKKLVMLIGESGVGKTSLIQAGVIPDLERYKYIPVHFSFQGDPIANLVTAINEKFYSKGGRRNRVTLNKITTGNISTSIKKLVSRRNCIEKILVIGDHLEQLFTTEIEDEAKEAFVITFSKILAQSDGCIKFLFCLRQDYLADLYDLSQEIPELYDRNNTFRLHKLSRENGHQALLKASECAKIKLDSDLMAEVLLDLCEIGEGLIYPPYFQIVGYRLYEAAIKTLSSSVSFSLYESLGKSEDIINNYFDGLLDMYSDNDKKNVCEILKTMVTDYYTKKRVTEVFLKKQLLYCENLDELLKKLVKQRIVRRSFDEYELMHDSLAYRIINLIEKKKLYSYRVRKAIKYIEQNYHNKNLTSKLIALSVPTAPSYLASLFREQLRKTINEHLNNFRIAKAKDLLTNTVKPIGEITDLVGFKTQSSFSRKFRECENMNPLKYRKDCLEGRSGEN